MIRDTDDTLPGGPQASAAEYVLGLLPRDERLEFERALAKSTDLQQEIVAWAEYFATLTDPIPEVAPPPQVLRRIEVQVFAAKRRPGWRLVLPYLVGAVAAGFVAWAVLTSGLLTPVAHDLQAALTAPSGDLTFRATFDSAAGELTLTPIAADLLAGRVYQLWLVADAQAAPVSLGLLGRQGGTVLALPPLLAQALPGATLSVTEEPPGGSTTGVPSGPIMAQGQLTPA